MNTKDRKIISKSLKCFANSPERGRRIVNTFNEYTDFYFDARKKETSLKDKILEIANVCFCGSFSILL